MVMCIHLSVQIVDFCLNISSKQVRLMSCHSNASQRQHIPEVMLKSAIILVNPLLVNQHRKFIILAETTLFSMIFLSNKLCHQNYTYGIELNCECYD